MENHIEDFFNLVLKKEIEIYNEFSLQHELGIFLRGKIENQKVQFERNVLSSAFDFNIKKFEPIKDVLYKKEIDISIYSESDLSCVMELKYPRNGQVPESMFSFCKDIAFLEQLLFLGFKSAYFIAVAEHEHFYSGNSKEIYGYFRNEIPITGEVVKPTGKKDDSVIVTGEYIAKWLPINDKRKYCLIKVDTPASVR